MPEEDVIRLNAEQMEAWEEALKRQPGYRKMWGLIAADARQRGGVALEFWRRKVGPAFGEPVIMSAERISREIGVPVSDLERIYAETRQAVQPQLDQDPDYQRLQRERPRSG